MGVRSRRSAGSTRAVALSRREDALLEGRAERRRRAFADSWLRAAARRRGRELDRLGPADLHRGPPRVRSSEPPGVATSTRDRRRVQNPANVMSALAWRSPGLRRPPKFHDVAAPPPRSHCNTRSPRCRDCSGGRSPETSMSSADMQHAEVVELEARRLELSSRSRATARRASRRTRRRASRAAGARRYRGATCGLRRGAGSSAPRSPRSR